MSADWIGRRLGGFVGGTGLLTRSSKEPFDIRVVETKQSES
jgi:hypothetical protein